MLVDIMQVITTLVNIYISFTEKKKNIYLATFLLNFSQLLMYFFNGDITTGLIYIIIVIRSFIYLYKDKCKSNLIPIFIIIIQIAIGFATMQNYIQILSILIPCYSTYYLWFYKDTQKLRVGNIIANSLWAAYNVCTGLYIILIMRAITIVSNLVAFIKRKIELKKT